MNYYKLLGCGVSVWLSMSASAQLYEFSRKLYALEDQSGLSGFELSIGVLGNEIPSGYRYLVAAGVRATGLDGRFLQSSDSAVSFANGTAIGPESILYSNPFDGGSSALVLCDYSWRIQYPGNGITVTPGREYFLDQTEILLGFSRGHPGPAQYGWIRMRREVGRVQDMFDNQFPGRQYVFLPVEYAIHPIAEHPIRAGFAPEFPSLSSVVETGEDGTMMIRIGWPAGWNGMRLETTYALEDPTVWTPVLDVTGNEAVFALPEDGELYFRLNYVP